MSDEISSLISQLESLLEYLKEIVSRILSDPRLILFLGFLLMLIVVTQALSHGQNAPFSRKAALVISIILSFYGATLVAENLPFLGSVVALIVVVALPVTILLWIVRRGR